VFTLSSDMVKNDKGNGNRDSLPKLILSILHFVGIEFWIVALGPFYIGWAIASHQIYPDTRGILGLVTIGPLLGGFTFLFNDYSDMLIDNEHRRKKTSPLLKGIIEPKTILYSSYALGLLGLFLAFILSVQFSLIVILVIILSLLYSHPSIKLKAVGGFDIAINMIGIGFLCPLGGWIIGGGNVFDFPIYFLLSIVVIIGGLYAPTTVADYDVDKAHGVKTLAVRIGPRRTIILAHIFLTTGFASLIIEGWFDHVLTRPILSKTWPFLVMPPLIYLIFLRKPTYSNIVAALVLVSIVSGLGTMLFLLYYSGQL